MGKKSIKQDKNAYFDIRDNVVHMSRDLVYEKTGISDSRLERIENGAPATPREIKLLADCYKKPELKNYYCRNDCDIGHNPDQCVRVEDLTKIVLEMLSDLNSIEKRKDRLIDITADGQISEDELKEFANIQEYLNHISLTVEALKLWVEQTIADGKMDKKQLDSYAKNKSIGSTTKKG